MTDRDLPLRKKRIRYIGIIVASIVALFIIGGGIYTFSKKSYESLNTSVAQYDNIIKAITTQVFVVRDEDYVVASGNNIVSAVNDGTRVGKDMCVAYSFANSSAASNVMQIKEIENQLVYYKKLAMSASNVSATELEVLDSNVQNSLFDFINTVSNGKMSDFAGASNNLRSEFASKQIAMGQTIDVSKNIADLEAKLSSLVSASGSYSQINADHPGYYISSVDGFENTLDYSKVDQWSFDDILQALSSTAKKTPDGAIGKLVNNYQWYIACIVESDSVSGLETGDRKTISFPFSTADNIKAQVYKLKNDKNGKTLIIFKCDLMNEDLSELRNETAQIYVSEYEGCKIDNRAIRQVEGETGVYVVRANTAVFKKIYVYYSADDYSIVDYPLSEDENGEPIEYDESDYLSVYDEYIIGGSDLYDGKYLK